MKNLPKFCACQIKRRQYDRNNGSVKCSWKVNVIINNSEYFMEGVGWWNLYVICAWKNSWFWGCCCQHYTGSPTGLIISSWIWNQIKLLIVTLYKTRFWFVCRWYLIRTWDETLSILSEVYYGFSYILSSSLSAICPDIQSYIAWATDITVK